MRPAARVQRASVSSARSSAHPAPLKLRIQATLDFRVNSAPSQLQVWRECMASAKRSSGGVCSGEWGLRLLRIEENARARTETTKPAAKRKLLLQFLLSSPLMRLNLHVESFCGAIATAFCSSSGSSSWLCGTANGCAAAALLAARSDRLVARLHRSRILMRIRS